MTDANRAFIRDARMRLGNAWGLGRPLSYSELGRALGLAGDPGNGARDLERRGIVSGPVRKLIGLYLGGAPPGVVWREKDCG